ncbi:unnamed protein product [Schistosoma mattheei]|uniref:Reverse transcriptase domain-containing protein n=1 Tax=Schistosoma mattheei TaxID=31246 RepID=A0A3P8CY04_9TREM|nr:unnamed protein product [Schistosoma mattheei]
MGTRLVKKAVICNRRSGAINAYGPEDFTPSIEQINKFMILAQLLRHYGVPEKIINIIMNSYDGLNCKIVHGGQLTNSFEVKTGVRQGCLLSPFLFLLERPVLGKVAYSHPFSFSW